MYLLKLIFKNALRHKLRTGLTVLGLVAGVAPSIRAVRVNIVEGLRSIG